MNINKVSLANDGKSMLPHQYYKYAGSIDFTSTISLKMKTPIRKIFSERHIRIFKLNNYKLSLST